MIYDIRYRTLWFTCFLFWQGRLVYTDIVIKDPSSFLHLLLFNQDYQFFPFSFFGRVVHKICKHLLGDPLYIFCIFMSWEQEAGSESHSTDLYPYCQLLHSSIVFILLLVGTLLVAVFYFYCPVSLPLLFNSSI